LPSIQAISAELAAQCQVNLGSATFSGSSSLKLFFLIHVHWKKLLPLFWCLKII